MNLDTLLKTIKPYVLGWIDAVSAVTPNAGRRLQKTTAGSVATFGVVDTRHLIVDAAGYGDYTTIQAALDYIMGLGTGSESYTILIRNGTYPERLTFQPAQGHPSRITLIGDGDNVVIAAPLSSDANSLALSIGPYANPTFRNLKFAPSGSPSNLSTLIHGLNGNTLIFYDCYLAPLGNQRIASGNGSIYFYHCTIGNKNLGYTYGLFGSPGVSTLTLAAWDCLFQGNAAASQGLIVCNIGNAIYLYHCAVKNDGAGWDLWRYAGGLHVARSIYDRTKTSGTITVLDGDIPALTVDDIPTHDIISKHSASGLTAGAVLRATDATAFAFGALDLANSSAVTGLLPDANIASAATWHAKQTASAILSTFGALANAAGYLKNDGAGALSYVAAPLPGAHNVLDSTYHGDVLAGAIMRGDILYGNATPKIARLALGGITGSVLTRDATDIGWSAGALSFGGAYTLTVSGTGYAVLSSVTGYTSGRAAIWGTGNYLQSSNVSLLAITAKTLYMSGAGDLTTTLDGGGEIYLGGYALTVPATGTAALLGVANTFTTGVQTIQTGADENKGLIIKCNSATQSANLQEWQDSDGNIRMWVTSDPSFHVSTRFNSSTAKVGIACSPYQSGTGSITGLNMQVNCANASSMTTAIGGSYIVAVSGAGGVANAYAGWFRTNTSNGTIVSASGVYIASPIISGSGAITNLYGLQIAAMSGATVNRAISTAGGQLSFTHNADNILATFTGHTTLAAESPIIQVTRNDTTAGVSSVLGLTGLGSGAAGDGVSLDWYQKSSTTAAQQTAKISALWTDATHATKTSRLQLEATGPGHAAQWSYDDIAGSAITIIADGAGDVTKAITLLYTASEVTGTDVSGGMATLEPGDAHTVCNDGTNILTLTCNANGSVTIARSAGTDTYKFSAWMVWH